MASVVPRDLETGKGVRFIASAAADPAEATNGAPLFNGKNHAEWLMHKRAAYNGHGKLA